MVGLSSIFAAYAMTSSVGSDQNGMFFCGLVLVGTIFSFFMSRLAAKYQNLGTLFYCAVGVIAWFRGFESLIPEPFFTGALSAAGWLLWMVSLGSFFTWRDSTLLFQAVPSVALFGLVGCFDVYKSSTALFFVFLLCLATIMARAHARMMMRLAVKSGYTKVENLSEGPWRWMAGPEWALASAAAIIVVSLLGAPILQQSAWSLGISGFIQVQTPRIAAPQQGLFNDHGGSVAVGLGPLTVSRTPVVRVHMLHKEYLRSNSYDEYVGGGWKLSEPTPAARRERRPLYELASNLITNKTTLQFTVELLVAQNFVPSPPEVWNYNETRGVTHTWDGALSLDNRSPTLPSVIGESYVPANDFEPTQAAVEIGGDYPSLLDTGKVADSVKELARSLTKNAKNDFERAKIIQGEIGNRCRYNLKAPPVPSGSDAIDYFLFKSHEGYCDLFASSMVTMARSVGIPARYVVGYLPVDAPKGNTYIVKQSDAHAWAELLFRGAGWVKFDATEDADEVLGAGRGETTDGPFLMSPWFRFGIVPIGLAAVAWGIAAVYKRKRYPPERRAGRRELARIYARFERTLTPSTGHPRRLSQTPQEFLLLGRKNLGLLYPVAVGLNQSFEMALYGPKEPEAIELVALAKSVEAFRLDAKKALAQSRAPQRSVS